MARYGVGILGAGWVAGEYVRVFRDQPQCEIAGVYNRTAGVELHASIHDTVKSMAVVFAIEESLVGGGEPVRVADVLTVAV